MSQALVDLECTGDETTATIVDQVVFEVQMRQDLRLKKVLGNLTRASLTNLVVRKVELCDCLVYHEALLENTGQVIVY